MTAKASQSNDRPPGAAHRKEAKPEWANGLKQLYDSVVDEPLPDSFKDLLAQLDEPVEGKREPGE